MLLYAHTGGILISVHLFPDFCQELYFKREINSTALPLILIQAILSLVTNNNQKKE